jgi:hypothetical protein
VSSYPARLVGEHVPKNVDRLEVRTTTRRHRALVRSTYAAVVFGVLGYTRDEHSSRLHAAEFISRARAWLCHHHPRAVRDPDATSPIDWTPDPTSARAYHRSPTAYHLPQHLLLVHPHLSRGPHRRLDLLAAPVITSEARQPVRTRVGTQSLIKLRLDR